MRTLFLQWIPWVLRMARPGEKITRKTIMMQNKMKELDLKEKSSKSLLANVLDMDDDFVPSSQLPHPHTHIHAHQHQPAGQNNVTQPQQKNGGFIRYSDNTQHQLKGLGNLRDFAFGNNLFGYLVTRMSKTSDILLLVSSIYSGKFCAQLLVVLF